MSATPNTEKVELPYADLIGQPGMDPSSKHDEAFLSHLALLHQFMLEHGHTNVPDLYVTHYGVKLGRWVGRIRRAKTGKDTMRLTQARIEALNRLGFIWDIRWHSFVKHFRLLKAYRREHGHVNIPVKYVTPCGVKLGAWVNNVRNAYAGQNTTRLTPPRIKALNKLGFVWDAHWHSFVKHLRLLKQYRREHGHANVPTNHVTPCGVKLGRWVVNIRRSYTSTGRGHLTPPRIKALNKLGFVWQAKRGPRKS